MAGLLLIPTQLEADRLIPELQTLATLNSWKVDLCGFGLVASAARTSQLIAEHQPDRVVLAGIAGSFGDRLPLGEAFQFSEVICHGIGVGSGNEFRSAKQLGWMMLDSPGIGDCLSLLSTSQDEHTLVSSCSASSCPKEAEHRRDLYPSAEAEDMEGFSVALSCKLHEIPVSIVRGISNRVGDRDHAGWKIDKAIQSVAHLLTKEFLK